MTWYDTCKIGQSIPDPDTRTKNEIHEGRMQNVELDFYMDNVRENKTTDQLFLECVDYEYVAIRRALDHKTATNEQCYQLAEDYVYTVIETRFERLCEDVGDDDMDIENGDTPQDMTEKHYREVVLEWMYLTEGPMYKNGPQMCIGTRAKNWQNHLEERITRGFDPINIPDLQESNPEHEHGLPRERPWRGEW